MELTKSQIQQIDNRLKSGGIKYWDLRLEIIDHIATDLEQNSKSNDFNKELNNSLKRIGYLNNENLQMGAFQEPEKYSERLDFVISIFEELGKRLKQRAGSPALIRWRF